MIDEKVLLQSRPEALNDKMDMDLQNQKGGYNNGWNDCLFMFIDIIKRQQKVGEWIPFTFDEEGVLNCELPDIDEDILVWDILDAYVQESYPGTFKMFNNLMYMKKKGYFKNVDPGKELKEILKNCVVIERKE